MPEQVAPASRRPVALGNHGDWIRPVDRKIWIVMGHCEVGCGIVGTVDAVAHIRRRRQGLEAVKESGRDIEVAKVIIVQQERLLHTESWRLPADVDDDVMHRTMRATDQLGLARRGPAMHPSDDPLRGPRLRILHESGGCSGGAEVPLEELGVERSGEQSPFVAQRMRYEDGNSIQIGLLDSHHSMLS